MKNMSTNYICLPGTQSHGLLWYLGLASPYFITKNHVTLCKGIFCYIDLSFKTRIWEKHVTTHLLLPNTATHTTSFNFQFL